ncbi:extracellular solute-binding protein [Phycicoccus endophyticus]|uniref:Extracellular solute-binding protein n=1 Tax=Phycicoccus endophyticus TaxID=1690220 RepID=A0A7G9QYN8_9MICO|nr:extracellular solute-binding protein [Phycicoccus endophyticus]NHI20502.1 extracellular solute-binding protein [Phycicoccus endophyticus]QNN48463.1 extracellular solute-binding protein [Phycicoccus endophyticus]
MGIAAGAALAVGLSACAGGSTDESEGSASGTGGASTVTFRSWSPIEQTTAQMVKAFTDENAGTSIDATVFNYPEYLVDLQTRASSNTMPDIVGLQPGALTQQYRDKLMPLQQCASDTWGSDWQSKFYPIGIEQARMGNPDGDENFYALPLLVQTVNLWGNSEIFEDKGVTAPTTWEELESVVKKLSGESYAPFMLPAKDSWLRNVVFLQIANNIEPGLVYQAEDGTDSWTNPRIVEAFEYWSKLFTDGIAQKGAIGLDAYPSGANQFEAGNAAMIPLGAWWIQQSDPSREDLPPLSEGMAGYEPFLFPTIPGGASEAQYVGGIDVALGISKDSANPDLACKVLTDWIAGAGAQKLVNTFNDLPAVTGMNPETFTSDKQQEMWAMFTEDWMPKVQWSRYLESPKVDTALGDALAGVATGDLTPQQAAEKVQSAQDAAS